MDGLTATETLRAIVKRVRRMVEQQYACWRDELLPALAANGIRLLELAELDQAEFGLGGGILPRAGPPGADAAGDRPGASVPAVAQQVAELHRAAGDGAGPARCSSTWRWCRSRAILPRMIKLPRTDARQDYVYLDRLIGHYLADLFPGTNIAGLLAVPRDAQQRALHRRGGDGEPAQSGRE